MGTPSSRSARTVASAGGPTTAVHPTTPCSSPPRTCSPTSARGWARRNPPRRPALSIPAPSAPPLIVAQPAPRGVELVWAGTDRWPQLGYLAAGGLLAVAAMAVVGLPPVDLHGPLHYLGVMDPACGLTRGVVALARGRLATAWTYNPASPLVLAGGVGALVRLVIGRRTGRWLEVRIAPHRRRLAMLLAALALLGLWANQQQHAALLRPRPRTSRPASRPPRGHFAAAGGGRTPA